jgi:cytochrome P450
LFVFIISFSIAEVTTILQTFVHALLYVAAYPDEVAQLREEINQVIASEGWTRAAINHMPKLDSFVRETQRLSGMANGTSIALLFSPPTKD